MVEDQGMACDVAPKDSLSHINVDDHACVENAFVR